MKKLNPDVVNFFQNQGFVIVSTIDKHGYPNNACKGVVEIGHNGHVYLFDLYHGETHANLGANQHVSITAIDEHKFIGYCLKGKARIVTQEDIKPHLVKAWEERIASRLTSRLLKNMRGEKGHSMHPEALLPKPKYLISIDVEEVKDLTPQRLKEE